MGEFGVSEKEANKNSSSDVLGFGVKVQNLEDFPSKAMMMMVPHNHHYRRLSPFDNDSWAGDGDGPTTYMSMTNHIDHVVSGASASGAAIDRGGAALVRPLQPFDVSTSTSVAAAPRPAFKSSGGMMAASLGFPFTNAQWKELERQAMIYKYMMASAPVPPDLVIPTAASRSPLDSGFNLRFSSGTDPEPGRCRRTDGKKWRCSRDVAPNHKYCERHMHRGRPRSRKPVEVQVNSNNNQQIKRSRRDSCPFPTPPAAATISNPIISNEASSSQFLSSPTSQPFFESSLSLDKFGVKAANFDSVASLSSNKEPRGLDWILKGDPITMAASEQEWQPLMQNKVGLNTGSSCNNNASISSSNYKDPLYMNSHAFFNSGLDQHKRLFPLCLNPLIVPMENPHSVKPRGFIDAWCNTETEENNANANKNSVASDAKLSLSSLDLSMGGGGCVGEDMGTIQMGLGLMDSDGNTENGNKTHLTNWLTPAPWAASTPGGPLAEVLRASTVATGTTNEEPSKPSSPVSSMVTMVSSPSGVLQKTLTSLSDSSSSSSPRVGSSRANSEIALLWFNRSKLASSS